MSAGHINKNGFSLLMKILFLHKRHYMQKDLVNDCYGRFYEIPDYLAKLGHQVHLVCQSYRKSVESEVTDNENFTITSLNLGWNPLFGFYQHYLRLNELLGENRPDIIIAGSDCYQIIIGSALAKRHSIPFVADLYDNFAWYKASWIPGVLLLFQQALKSADAITVVSGTLMQLVETRYKPFGKLYLVENAISNNFLAGHKRAFSREYFGFERNRFYIGTAGELSHEKGVDLLVNAFIDLAGKNDNIGLVLAGKKHKLLDIPARDDICYLGELSHDEIPLLFSALDVGVVCICDNDFGRYCFPQKLYEMVACELPIVVSDVGEMSTLLKYYPAMRFSPGNVGDMERAILGQMKNREKLVMDVPTWKQQAEKFDVVIRRICEP